MSDENENDHDVAFETLLDSLSETPNKLATLTDGLSDAELCLKYSENEFSVIENFCHLRDLELQGYARRINRMVDENDPLLPDFDGARIAAEGNYNNQPAKRATLNAIVLRGAGGIIARVKCIHFGAGTTGNECFVLSANLTAQSNFRNEHGDLKADFYKREACTAMTVPWHADPKTGKPNLTLMMGLTKAGFRPVIDKAIELERQWAQSDIEQIRECNIADNERRTSAEMLLAK